MPEPTNGAANILTGGNEPTEPNNPANPATPSGTNNTDPAPQIPDGYVALPTDKSTPEELAAFYGKLGRPESADKYGLAFDNDENGEVAKALAPAMFEAGLTAKQAAAVQDALNGFAAGKVEAYAAEQDRQMKELQKGWGADYEKNTELARQAMRAYGLNKEQLVRMETAMGSKELMEFLHKIGSNLADPELKGVKGSASPRTGASYTREEAMQKMEELKKDPEFGKKFLAKDKEALKLFNDLNHIIAGGN